MKAKTGIKVCFSTRVKREGFIEWERFWEVTNEESFGRDYASYHVAINNSMPISEFMNIGQEIKAIIEYRNKCNVDLSHNGITYSPNGMISEINLFFRGK